MGLGICGCDGANHNHNNLNDSGRASTGGIQMSESPRIPDARQALAAFEQANRTNARIIPLLRELKRTNLTQHERAKKKQEVERLRSMYRSEIEPVKVFYRELALEISRMGKPNDDEGRK